MDYFGYTTISQGRGKRPAWLMAKIAAGFALEDFAAGATKSVKNDAGSAGGQGTKPEGLFEADEEAVA